ncbi:MAG: c-type cytochrome [Alphaproteobacteria bacterium]
MTRLMFLDRRGTRRVLAMALGLTLVLTLSLAALPADAEDAPSGEKVFADHCASCHAAGPGHPATIVLGVTRGEDFAVLQERTDLPADYVVEIVRNGLQGMPGFRPTELTDAEVAAVARHIAGDGE